MLDITTLKDKDGTLQFIRDFKTMFRELTAPFAKDWKIDLRRIAGHLEGESGDISRDHHAPIVGSTSAGTVTDTKYASVIAFYFPQYMRVLGRVLDTIKGYQCISASNETDDRSGTYAGEQLLKEYLASHSGKYYQEVVRMVAVLNACGCCPTTTEGVAKFGEIDGESVDVNDGDVQFKAHLPQDLWQFPVHDVQDSPAIVVVRRETKAWGRERWPGIKFEKDLAGAKWDNNSGMGFMMPGIDKTLVEYKQLLVRPCDEFPDGLERVIIGEKAVWDNGELDTHDKTYPAEFALDVPLGVSFYSRGRMAMQSPLQVVADEAWSKAIEIVKRHAGRTYFVPPSSQVKAEDFTDKSVAVIEAAMFGGAKPEWVDMPSVQPLLDVVQFCASAMEEISAQHGPAKGVPSGSRTPARTTESLIEQSELADHTFNMLLRGTMSRVGKRILAEGQRVWPEEKVLYVLGKNRRYEAMTFKKANLGKEWDVRVAPDSGLPRGKSARGTILMKILEAGGFGQPGTPEATQRFQELMDFATDDQIFGNEASQREIENAKLHFHEMEQNAREASKTGAPPAHVEVGWDDVGPLHVMQERQMLKERKNAAYGRNDPEIGILSDLVGHHCAKHGDPAALQQFPQVPPPPPPGAGVEQALAEQQAVDQATQGGPPVGAPGPNTIPPGPGG